jgi:site-specific recombinase XerD
MVYLNKACIDAIEAYLPHRISPKTGHKNALFISKQGKRMSVQTVKQLVNKYLMLAGLGQKHCSVHKLRHTAATLMYQNGVDVRTLKEVLGHENLDTTMIYTHIVDENLRDAAARNPLSGQKPKK